MTFYLNLLKQHIDWLSIFQQRNGTISNILTLFRFFTTYFFLIPNSFLNFQTIPIKSSEPFLR